MILGLFLIRNMGPEYWQLVIEGFSSVVEACMGPEYWQLIIEGFSSSVVEACGHCALNGCPYMLWCS